MPRVSVVIPIFNAERYLSEAIDSILRQTFEDFEVLLLDDGSSDRSVEIGRLAAAKDDRIVLVTGAHHGVVYWRNAGLDMARAELVAMMDSDDIALPDRLARQVHFLDDHPECCAVGAQVLRIDGDGLPISEWHVPQEHEQIDAAHMAGKGGAIVNPTVLMRRAAVIQAGRYRLGYESAEDYDLFLRMAEVGRLSNLPSVQLKYRLHLKSLTFARAEYQAQMARQALAEAWVRRKRAGPLPAPVNPRAVSSEDELMWAWARSSFKARNFRTARSQSYKLLRKRPYAFRRWILFLEACFGPVAFQLEHIVRDRAGSKRPPNARS